MVSDVYELGLTVNTTTSNKSCDRTLDSVKMHNLIKRTLREQVEEMKEFSLE
jgi:hypothetical protein